MVSADPLARADENWQQAPGYRFLELTVPRVGHAGFSLLSPPMTGMDFTNALGAAKAAENQIRLNGSGVALGDIDGDGWCDLYVCGLERSNALYRNLGGWRFTNITDKAAVECAGQYSTGATLVDLDGDGDLDLLVNGIGTGTRLFVNDGHGVFAEAAQSGLVRGYGAMTSALGDVDGDGDLDLYVANYRTRTIRSTGFAVLNVDGRRTIRPEDRDHLEYTPEGLVLEHGEADILYHNEGGHRFVAQSWTNGTFLDEDGKPFSKPAFDWGLTAMFRDLNGDGAPDLYVCNDFHSPDRVWLNDGRGRFRALPRLALRNMSTFSMAVDFADIDRDGWDDIFTADMLSVRHSRRLMQAAGAAPYSWKIGVTEDRPQFDRNTLQLNRGDGTYAEVAWYAGLAASEWTWAALFLDVDLDGYEDLLAATGNLFDLQDRDAEARIVAKGPWRREDIARKLLMYPNLYQPKMAFRNRGNVTFEDRSRSWGFDQVGAAHGMALADLDNDGDLDVAVNNLNGAVGLYRNESNAARVAVRLKGVGGNTRGIGATIWLHGGAVARQSQEMICGGRYLSSDDPQRVFAVGSQTNVMRLEVRWRSGKRSVVTGVNANRLYEIEEAGAEGVQAEPPGEIQPVFRDESASLGHVHEEEFFDDFARQPLLPRKLSQLGPGVAWSDVDGDGRDELIVGSGKGGRLAVYRNNGLGGFERMTNGTLATDVTRDQTGVVGLGVGKILVGSANHEDGLATGGSVREYDLGKETVVDSAAGGDSSAGPLALGDIDGNGELDLVVGGRVIAGKYPEAASTRVYRRAGGKWMLDEANSRLLEKAGLVSGAVLSDLDGDGFPELILACEWGPVRVFHNERGRLKEVTKELGLDRYTGWWNGVSAGDFDGDGRLDIVATNWGQNSKCRATAEQPRTLYHGDLDGDGTVDIVEAFYDEPARQEVPERALNVMVAALPFVREKYPTFASYGSAGVTEIFGERLKVARTLRASTLTSTIFLNRGTNFVAQPLPKEAQLSPALGICVGDFDGNGHEDVFLSQNFFALPVDSTRSDAGRGLWLRGDGRGSFQAVNAQASGIKVYGEQRGAALCDYDADGRVDLVVAQNGAATKLYRNTGARPGLRVRLEGPSGNPTGAGAQLRLIFGQLAGPVREIHAGGGYWSQDSAVQVLATPVPPSTLWVRWPGGAVQTVEIPRGAASITVSMNSNATGRAVRAQPSGSAF